MRTCVHACKYVHSYMLTFLPSFIHPSLQPSIHSLAVASQALTPGRNVPESVPSAVMWSPSKFANRGMIHGAISNKNTVCHDTTKTKRNGWKVVKWNAHWWQHDYLNRIETIRFARVFQSRWQVKSGESQRVAKPTWSCSYFELQCVPPNSAIW